MGIRFSRLHFFKRFNIENDFILLRNITIGGVVYEAGTVFDKSLLPAHKVKNLFNSRKIAVADSVYENTFSGEKDLTSQEESDIVVPEIKPAGPAWFKVWLGQEQIGKTVRTKQEAEEIVSEWLKANQ